MIFPMCKRKDKLNIKAPYKYPSKPTAKLHRTPETNTHNSVFTVSHTTFHRNPLHPILQPTKHTHPIPSSRPSAQLSACRETKPPHLTPQVSRLCPFPLPPIPFPRIQRNKAHPLYSFCHPAADSSGWWKWGVCDGWWVWEMEVGAGILI